MCVAQATKELICYNLVSSKEHMSFNDKDSGFLLLILSDYVHMAHSEGRLNLAEDALAYWSPQHPDEAALFAAAIQLLRTSVPRALSAPPVTWLPARTLLYNVQPAVGQTCTLRAKDWFVIDLVDIDMMIDFQRLEHSANLRVCTYQITTELALFHLTSAYTYVDFERFIAATTPNYVPSFTDYGMGDNHVPANWMERNIVQFSVVGWHQRRGALPVAGAINEVMLVNAAAYLVLVEQRDIKQKRRRPLEDA